MKHLKKALRTLFATPFVLGETVIFRRKKYDTVQLRLQGSYPESHVVSPWQIFQKERKSYFSLLKRIEFLKRDPSLKNVIITIAPHRMGYARTFELHRRLRELRANGKKLYAVLEGGGTREYLLAAACDSITVVPSASLFVTGLSFESIFVAELLSRYDIEPDLLNEGKYKNAAETFTRKTPSKPAKEMMTKIVTELHREIVEILADGRGQSKEKVEEWIDHGPYYPAKALEFGLIDQIAYSDEVVKKIREKEKSYKAISSERHYQYHNRMSSYKDYIDDSPRIAVLTAAGPITDNKRQGTVHISPPDFIKTIRAIRRDPQIKAVVLRVASPGGSGLASDLIYRELIRLKKKKPLVVSMSDVAGSGGYYLAMAGDTVLTEGGTLTGSIGVISGKFSLKGLYRKFGINKEIYSKGEGAGILSDYGKFTDVERERMEALNKHFYSEFTSKVADSRGLSPAQVENAAQGRVVTGREAVSLGLADRIGGLWEAILEAVSKIGGEAGRFPHIIHVEPLRSSMFGVPRLSLPAASSGLVQEFVEEISLLDSLNSDHGFIMPEFIRAEGADWW